MSIHGLPNIGLSCYINSVLQAIFNIEEIRIYILNTTFENENSFAFYLQCVLKNLNEEFDQNSDKKSEHLELMYKIFKSFCEKFQETKQGDANHFLIFLLNKLDLEIKNNFDEINIRRSENLINDDKNRNIITDLFRGEQEDRIICEKCNITEDQKTKQHFFSLAVSADKYKNTSIDDLLMTFFGLSYIENTECSICQGPLLKHTIVTRWPTYLIINICRSQAYNGEMIKINSKVFVKDHILTVEDHSNFYSNEGNVTSKKIEYTLQAVVNHFGNSYSGHYTCISITNFLWVQFNDLHLQCIDKELVISENNNLLFFKRINIRNSDDSKI